MGFRRRIGVISLGCSKNRINSEQMMFKLSSAGYDVTGEPDGADIVLINTCGFIESAKTEAIENIFEQVTAKETGRIEKIIVAGCLPERYKDSIGDELPEVDAFVGTGSFDDIVNVVESVEKTVVTCHPALYFGDINAPVSETPRILSTSHVWAYLKIAEGCDNRCSYCCIPDIRGCFRSRPIENIISEAKKLVDAGVLELILVAQDLTGYGIDLYKKRSLGELLKELEKIKNLRWIRLHYLYPDDIDNEIIDVIAKSDKILKYLDIPIQHINTGVLKKMRRRGSGDKIRGLFEKLRERIPGVVLRTSLITGLPGEGENEFRELYDFLSEAKIERVGVFAYSPETGTEAALMGRPSRNVALKRADKLLELQTQIIKEHNESRLGLKINVLIEDAVTIINGSEYFLSRSYCESPDVDGFIYIKKTKKSLSCINKITEVRITGMINGELTGILE